MADQRTGSSQWCPKHWAKMREHMEQTGRTTAGIVATGLIMQRFIDRGTAEGFLGRGMSKKACNREMHHRAPLCCWLGEDAMGQVYAEAMELRVPRGLN